MSLVALGYVQSDNPILAVGILVVAVASNMAIYCGHHVNHMDLSPNFAGPLMGCTNAIANICSIIAPLVAGAIVQEKVCILLYFLIHLLIKYKSLFY